MELGVDMKLKCSENDGGSMEEWKASL